MPDDAKRTIAHDPAVQALVRYKAHKYRLRAGLRVEDEKDVAQALFAGHLERFAGLDQDRKHALGFVTQVLNQVAANLHRECHAAKRDDRGTASLSTAVPTPEGTTPLANALRREDLEARTGASQRSAAEVADLRADVAVILDRLPADLRDLAERLMHDSESAVARDTGVARSTLQSRRQRLREVFERENLGEYL